MGSFFSVKHMDSEGPLTGRTELMYLPKYVDEQNDYCTRRKGKFDNQLKLCDGRVTARVAVLENERTLCHLSN